jgi:hypothetical protein
MDEAAILVAIELLDGDEDEELVGLMLLCWLLENHDDDDDDADEEDEDTFFLFLLMAARRRRQRRVNADTFYLRLQPDTPLSASAVYLQLRKQPMWWNKLFRFTPDDFFDGLVPHLDLPDSFSQGG